MAHATVAASPHQDSAASHGSVREKSARHCGHQSHTTAAQAPHNSASSAVRPSAVTSAADSVNGLGSGASSNASGPVNAGIALTLWRSSPPPSPQADDLSSDPRGSSSGNRSAGGSAAVIADSVGHGGALGSGRVAPAAARRFPCRSPQPPAPVPAVQRLSDLAAALTPRAAGGRGWRRR